MSDVRKQVVTYNGKEYLYCGNGPRATGDGIGWSMRPEILFRCVDCGSFVTGDPNIDESCECGRLYKDAGMGRLGSRLGDDAIEVFFLKSSNPYSHTQIAIKQLNRVRELLVLPTTDITWSHYNTIDEAIAHIDTIALGITNRDKGAIKELRFLFAPTGSLQEISINSGWSNEFLDIAKIIDTLK